MIKLRILKKLKPANGLLAAALFSAFINAHALDENTKEVLDKIVLGDSKSKMTPLKPSEMRALKKLMDAQEAAKNPPQQPPQKDPAYDQALQMIMRLTPQQIQQMNQMIDEIERAKAMPATLPTAVTVSNVVDLSPGSPIPKARLAANNTTSMVFLDATGEPWPVASYDPSIENSFHVTSPETQKHVLKISPKEAYAYGNISITFEKLNVPVVVQLIAGYEDVVDFRPEYHIAAQGPNARHTDGGTPKVIDDIMLSLIDGIAPTEARKLRTNDNMVDVWELNGLYYIRTRAFLLLPAPIASSQSSDGTRVYKAAKLPSLAMTINGKHKQIRVYD